MNIRVSAGPDQGAYEAASRHVLKPRLRSTRALGIAFLAFGVLEIVLALAFHDQVTYLPVGFGFVLVGYYFVAGLERRSVAAMLRNLSRANRTGHDYVITDESLSISGPYQHAVSNWYLFIGAEELPGQFILKVSRGQFLTVPTDRMTPFELQELRAFLTGRDWTLTGPPVQPTELPAGQ